MPIQVRFLTRPVDGHHSNGPINQDYLPPLSEAQVQLKLCYIFIDLGIKGWVPANS